MTGPDLDRLREAPAPGEGEARGRTREVLRAAHRGRPAPPRRVGVARVLAPALATLLVLGLVLTAPGDAVADWLRQRVREVVGTERTTPRPTPAAGVPGTGRLLTASWRGFGVLGREGLEGGAIGPVDAAAWSPRGRFVVVVRGAALTAYAPRARPDARWTVVAPRVGRRRLRAPVWSPSGYRIAYLAPSTKRGRMVLRVVAGDGTGDHAVAAAGVARPAWVVDPRASGRHLVAYADDRRRVVLRDADTMVPVWRSRPVPVGRPLRIVPSADGRLLAAQTSVGTTLVDARSGGLHGHLGPFARRTREEGLAARPGGGWAVVRRVAGTAERRVVRVDRRGRSRLLVAVPGPVRGLAWSPDGRWLAVGSVRADALLFLRPGPEGLAAARSLDGAADRYGGGRMALEDPALPGTSAGPFPRVEGWCCAR
ncbi:PD40 domain-containing protein [Conexibacter sp. SYSU D00693]|uniref:PD40 domain-containing protein n=1 Tax=Conexibacter sp. SYSU D00693 TaxID=2812560 RepID=UPI00196A8638|nr:PD40 domain-containing protein [Conexibacter sp. SYSU D00693]